jgi:hypothetical protein
MIPNQTGADKENCVKIAVRRITANDVTIVVFIFLKNHARHTTIEHGIKITLSTPGNPYRIVATLPQLTMNALATTRPIWLIFLKGCIIYK